jgi:hypothetical protein
MFFSRPFWSSGSLATTVVGVFAAFLFAVMWTLAGWALSRALVQGRRRPFLPDPLR